MININDRLLCIDSSVEPNTSKLFKAFVEEGKIYTVRSTRIDLEGKVGLLLNEIKNPLIYSETLGGKFEPGFSATRFQKLSKEDVVVTEYEYNLNLNE